MNNSFNPFKSVIEECQKDSDFPLKEITKDFIYRYNTILINPEKVTELSNYYKNKYKHNMNLEIKTNGKFINLHPELLPTPLYKKYMENKDKYTKSYLSGIIDKLIKEIKKFPFYSETDKKNILKLLIMGSNFEGIYREKLFKQLTLIDPNLTSEVCKYENSIDWVNSINIPTEDLDFSLRGILLIFSETLNFELDFATDEYSNNLYVNDEQLSNISRFWSIDTIELITNKIEILPMTEYVYD